MSQKHIAMLGTGYVGLVSGACFAELGNNVLCVDNVAAKIEALQHGKIPIYESGLEDLVRRNSAEGRLHFTIDIVSAIQQSDLIFLCLPTSSAADGQCDISPLLAVSKTIGTAMSSAMNSAMNKPIGSYKIIIDKSTVPPGTLRKIQQEIAKYSSCSFGIASNPEFLREGTAVMDFLKPDRVVVGTDSPETAALLHELYAQITDAEHPFLVVKPESAEEGKYASNTFLAMRVSYINEEAQRCEAVGADVEEVANIMSTDHRIGAIKAGPGWGGSCFPKDARAMLADNRGPLQLVRTTYHANLEHLLLSAKKIEKSVGGLHGKRIAIWGLAFKANTDDMREAPALTILPYLLEQGAALQVHDPKANENAKRYFGEKLSYCNDHYAACAQADALVVLTEWEHYKHPEIAQLKSLLASPTIIDLRNLFYPLQNDLKKAGFTYVGMGI